jgi:hypothetical protein
LQRLAHWRSDDAVRHAEIVWSVVGLAGAELPAAAFEAVS